MTRTDVEVADLGSGIVRINEYDFANCYLVLGEERAALIDVGVGIADLEAVVRGITDLPLTVLITHAHADHIGGAHWFGEVFLHPADEKRGRSYARPPARMYFLYCHKYKRKQHGVRYRDCFQRRRRPVIRPLQEGETIDLGGRTLEVVWTPGHSLGSLTFRDSATGALFTGDNVNLMVTLQFPGASDLRTWLAGAMRTLEMAGDAPIYGGHGGPIPREKLEEAIALAKDALKKPPQKGVHETRGAEKYPVIIWRG